MNIIKKVVIFVMGLVVIGVVSTAVGVTTQVKNVEKSVTFELLENDELAFNVYDKINEYAVYDDITQHANNLLNISINNDNSIFVSPYVNHNTSLSVIIVSDYYNGEPNIDIFPNNIYSTDELNVGDIITITFDVEQETPVIIKTLLMLVPLILSAGLIGYLVVKKGDE